MVVQYRFNPPQDVQKSGGFASRGFIIDEVWAKPEVNHSPKINNNIKRSWGNYSFCSQLIKWEDGSHSIRLAYYRRRVGENYWEFAGQTTITSEPSTIKKLLVKTLAKKEWFKR